MTSRKIFLIAPLLLAALACNLTGSPTTIPVPNQVATSVAATQTALASLSTPVVSPTAEGPHQGETSVPATKPAPTEVTEGVPTDTLPAGPTPAPSSRGDEKILILEPGINPSGVSSVTSPVHVAGQADPTFEQSLVVQVTDQNGAVIATVPTQIQADAGQRGPFGVDVPFK